LDPHPFNADPDAESEKFANADPDQGCEIFADREIERDFFQIWFFLREIKLQKIFRSGSKSGAESGSRDF